MTVRSLVREVEELGGHLIAAGDRLRVSAPHPLPDHLVQELRRHKPELLSFLRAPAWTSEDWQTFYGEREAILECDGGVPRTEAEGQAYRDCVTEWLVRNPAPSASDRCAWCGDADGLGSTIVPFWTGSHGHTWLHHGCWEQWYEEREANAVDALRQMGLTPPKCCTSQREG